MRQFDVFKNPNVAGRNTAPYVMVMQSNLHKDLSTQVVAPLIVDTRIKDGGALTPDFTIEGTKVRLDPTLMSAVHARSLRELVVNLEEHHYRMIKAIDMLFTGV